MRLIQGSTYEIPITLKVNGIAITPEDVDKVEIDIGRSTIKKTYPAGGGYYLPMISANSCFA